MDEVDRLIAEVERPTAWERMPLWFRRVFNRLRIAVAIYRVTRTEEARRARVEPITVRWAWKRSVIIAMCDRGKNWRCSARELFKPANDVNQVRVDPYAGRP